MKWMALLGLMLSANAAGLSAVTSKTGLVRSETIALNQLSPQSQYSFL
jgi:hypothetical protein